MLGNNSLLGGWGPIPSDPQYLRTLSRLPRSEGVSGRTERPQSLAFSGWGRSFLHQLRERDPLECKAASPMTEIWTGANPERPIARAPAGVRSIIRPGTKGPRSEMRTMTFLPFFLLVTLTRVPNGNVRCAAVSAPGFILSPLAVLRHAYPSPFP